MGPLSSRLKEKSAVHTMLNLPQPDGIGILVQLAPARAALDKHTHRGSCSTQTYGYPEMYYLR